MMAGPIISGALHKAVGYYYMNVVFGRFIPETACQNLTRCSNDVHASPCLCVLVSEKRLA